MGHSILWRRNMEYMQNRTAVVLGMRQIALELLNYPNECKIDQVNKNGNTALILSRNQ